MGQTALKLLVGHEQELLYIIPILLGCKMEDGVGGNLIEISPALNLLSLMKETAYSRLMEVSFPSILRLYSHLHFCRSFNVCSSIHVFLHCLASCKAICNSALLECGFLNIC